MILLDRRQRIASVSKDIFCAHFQSKDFLYSRSKQHDSPSLVRTIKNVCGYENAAIA